MDEKRERALPSLPNLKLCRTADESMAINRMPNGAIVIAGSGMCTGGRIVHHLLRAGQPVRCLVRPGSDGSTLSSAGAEVVPGDLTDAGSLGSACDGVDVVVASATAIVRRLAGAKGPTIREVDEVVSALSRTRVKGRRVQVRRDRDTAPRR